MEHRNKEFLLKNLRHFMDSPAPPTPLRGTQDPSATLEEPAAVSPMSGLAQHFNSASWLQQPLSPRRRLSLCSTIGTPSPHHRQHKLLQDLNASAVSNCDTSMSESPTMFKSTATSSGISSAIMSHRLRGSPLKENFNKENSSTSVPSLLLGSPLRNQAGPLRTSLAQSPLRRYKSPLEENQNCEMNSQDSGLDMVDPSTFRFAEPLLPSRTVSPRKSMLISPRKDSHLSPSSPRVKGGTTLFHCLSSGSESIDDGFLEFLSMDKEDDDANFPTGLGSLLSGKIVNNQMLMSSNSSHSPSGNSNGAKRSLTRSLSGVETTPVTTRTQSVFFKSPSAMEVQISATSSQKSFKRPERFMEMDEDQPAAKRRRPTEDESIEKGRKTSPRSLGPRSMSDQGTPRASPLPLGQSSLLNYGFQKQPVNPLGGKALHRCYSESEATIKNAVNRSESEPNLIGDFSRPFLLPLITGKHPDMRTITASTLAALVRGEYVDQLSKFTIVDCRYPYEYNGGHVKGSHNIYTKDQVMEVFINGNASSPPPRPSTRTDQRSVLIFHCEFSSERAPSLSRHLRQLDREANKECYPALHYPEVYLVHGGYKAFFEQHPELCEPRSYIPMLNQGNENDLKHFRAKSRSWAGDFNSKSSVSANPNGNRLLSKFSLKRLDV